MLGVAHEGKGKGAHREVLRKADVRLQGLVVQKRGSRAAEF